MKKLNKKGFTLAELLIVVAIIAVLVAITIPVFSTALDRANLARDAATVRALLAERIVDAMSAADFNGDVEVDLSAGEGALSNPLDGGSELAGGGDPGVALTVTIDGLPAITIPVDDDVDVTVPDPSAP